MPPHRARPVRPCAPVLGLAMLLIGAGTAWAQAGYPAPGMAPDTGPAALPTAYLGEPGFWATPPSYDFATTPYAMPTTPAGSSQPQGQPFPAGGMPGSAPVVSLPVTPLRLSDGPGTVDVQVSGAAPFRGYELVLTFDPATVALVAVSPGDLMANAGGTLQALGPILDTPGLVRYGVTLADTAAWPQGDGVLARFTFAPLAQNAQMLLRLAEAALVDPTGQRLNATTRDGAITVVAMPPPAAQTAAVASATALALATPAPAGSLGAGAGLGGLFARLGDMAPILAWLAAMALGLAVALAGWALGRR